MSNDPFGQPQHMGTPPAQSNVIEFSCPSCRRMLKVPPQHAGAKARCPSCQQITVVPSPAAANPAPAPAPFQSNPVTQSPAQQFNPVGQSPANPYASPAPQPFGQTPDYSTPAAPNPFGGVDYRCKQHPEMAAVARCKICFAPVCQTCRFDFSGGMAICPGCATNKTASMPSMRQGILTFAFLCAILSTLCVWAMFAGAVADENSAMVLFMVITSSAIIGFGLSLAGVDGRLGNTLVVWIALVWNAFIFVAVMALIVAGIAMQA